MSRERRYTAGPWRKVHRNNDDAMVTIHGVVVGGVVVDVSTQNEIADSHLIAAAPEMLEALEAAVWEYNGPADDCPEWIAQAHAAIAKAYGEDH